MDLRDDKKGLCGIDEIMQPLRNDYAAMANMFYGKAPGFDEILSFLSELENEIHNL